MAAPIDDNAADGNLDKGNVRLISVGYTRGSGSENGGNVWINYSGLGNGQQEIVVILIEADL